MCSPRFHVAPFRGFVLLVVVATGLHPEHYPHLYVFSQLQFGILS